MYQTPELEEHNHLEIVGEIVDVVREKISESGFDLDAEQYFIWMYALEPFPEA